MSTDRDPPRFGSPTLETAMLLTRAEALMARALGRLLSDHAISWPQALSLFVLAEQSGPISATRLVEKLGLGRTAMTSVVDRLEKQGWVRRQPSPVDRRVANLVLTEHGCRMVEAIRPVMQTALIAQFGDVQRESLTEWCAGIDRLSDVIRVTATLAGDI